jgi:hypothetical protein
VKQTAYIRRTLRPPAARDVGFTSSRIRRARSSTATAAAASMRRRRTATDGERLALTVRAADSGPGVYPRLISGALEQLSSRARLSRAPFTTALTGCGDGHVLNRSRAGDRRHYWPQPFNCAGWVENSGAASSCPPTWTSRCRCSAPAIAQTLHERRLTVPLTSPAYGSFVSRTAHSRGPRPALHEVSVFHNPSVLAAGAIVAAAGTCR